MELQDEEAVVADWERALRMAAVSALDSPDFGAAAAGGASVSPGDLADEGSASFRCDKQALSVPVFCPAFIPSLPWHIIVFWNELLVQRNGGSFCAGMRLGGSSRPEGSLIMTVLSLSPSLSLSLLHQPAVHWKRLRSCQSNALPFSIP
eukprot:COSAG06_NODE_148_length_22056_cov_75.881239_5_plen_149_part_00